MKVNKRYLKYLCCLAPFLFSSIVYTQTIGLFANILLAFKMLVFLYLVFDYIMHRKFSKLDFALAIYFLVWFLAVWLNGNSIVDYMKEVVVILSFTLLIENAFGKSEDYYLILAFEHILFLELVANFGCLILFPEGLWTTYSIYGQAAIYSFLGLDNQVTPILIIAELILLIRLQYENRKISFFSVLYGIVLIGNLYLMMSATGIIGCLIVPIVAWLGYKYRNYINIKVIIIAVFTVFLLIVVFRVQNIFSFIIEGLLNKDLSLSNRVGIWDRAVVMIKQKPIIGYGCGTLATIVGDRNAHDFYFQILLQSGTLGLIAYVNIFYVALKKCWENRHLNVSLLIVASLCGYMICCISEVYSQSWLIIILTLGYNVTIIPGGQTELSSVGLTKL